MVSLALSKRDIQVDDHNDLRNSGRISSGQSREFGDPECAARL